MQNSMENEVPLPHESDPHQQVTIPYFLYEAMARAYYGQPRNSDQVVEPVKTPEPQVPGNLNLSNIHFNPSDVPPTWRPGGVAARKLKHGSSDIQAPEEEA